MAFLVKFIKMAHENISIEIDFTPTIEWVNKAVLHVKSVLSASEELEKMGVKVDCQVEFEIPVFI